MIERLAALDSGPRTKEYMIGDEFSSDEARKERRGYQMDQIHEDFGDNCRVEEKHRDTMMEAVGSLVPARRRRIYYLSVTEGEQTHV